MGHSRQRIGTGSSHPKCIRDASTTSGLENASAIPWTKVCPPWGRTKRRQLTLTSQRTSSLELQKEGRLVAKALKEPQRQAFSKESDVVKVARWAYQKAHQANFEQEGSYDLSSIFKQMATSINLLGTKVHEVQEIWGSQKDLWLLTEWQRLLQKTSTFLDCLTHRVAKDHGPQRHPFLWGPAMMRWPDLLPLVWQRGQNEGTVVNHLWTTHHHLGLNCANCLDYFTTSAEINVTMPISVNPQPPVMMMTIGKKRTMRTMTMVLKMMSLSSKRTNTPN